MIEWAKKAFGLAELVRGTDAASVDGLLITGQTGFIAGTHVVSNLGWKAVEKLHVGDRVLSFDRGMQTIADVQHDVRHIPAGLHYTEQCPILIPEGALRNRRPLWLMPDQGILVESDIAMDDTGDPFAIVPAKSLLGHRGITLATPGEQINVTTLAFRNDEVIYVEGGMLAHCPTPRNLLGGDRTQEFEYHVLNLRAAKFLVACHMDDDEPVGLTYHPEEVSEVLRSRERPPSRSR